MVQFEDSEVAFYGSYAWYYVPGRSTAVCTTGISHYSIQIHSSTPLLDLVYTGLYTALGTREAWSRSRMKARRVEETLSPAHRWCERHERAHRDALDWWGRHERRNLCLGLVSALAVVVWRPMICNVVMW
jgi:hypothetical protein